MFRYIYSPEIRFSNNHKILFSLVASVAFHAIQYLLHIIKTTLHTDFQTHNIITDNFKYIYK